MLVMFRVKNYTSFKDEMILDLRRTSYREHATHVFKNRDYELLKTIAIYGANASGKSNLICAISDFITLVFSQFYEESDDINDEEISIKKVKLNPFLLSSPIDKKIEFEIVFIENNNLYQFGYCVEDSKICSEWLLLNDELIYEREEKKSQVKFGEKYSEMLSKYSRMREDRLYLSILDYFALDEEIKSIIDEFKNYFKIKFNIYFEIILETTIKGKGSFVRVHKELERNEGFRRRVSEYIRKIDVGINEIIVDEETMIDEREEKKIPIIKTIHNVYDKNNNVIRKEVFDLRQESSGTLRFISFIQEILRIMDNGGVFIVDELSSRLHPLLTKFIVDLFQSDINKNNSQLIFTTHEVTILNKDQFRRDEVVFVDKDARGVSSLFTLADLGVRQDASFAKDYFNGKYGAIPIIDYFNRIKEGE